MNEEDEIITDMLPPDAATKMEWYARAMLAGFVIRDLIERGFATEDEVRTSLRDIRARIEEMH